MSCGDTLSSIILILRDFALLRNKFFCVILGVLLLTGHFMKIYYSDSAKPEVLTQAIFLAGPSPRDNTVVDWRHKALEILEALEFKGEVFLPVPKNRFGIGQDDENWTYLNQVQWECDHRELADAIVFWVPRDIKGGMPAFTTNIEFGEDLGTTKAWYGRPPAAEKCHYLDQRYGKDALSHAGKGHIYEDLESLLKNCVAYLAAFQPATRQMGEVYVPLPIWKSSEFQSWYLQLLAQGNTLVKAKTKSLLTTPSGHLFGYTLQVDVYVGAEDRLKSNESVFFRKNISAVLPYYRSPMDEKTYLVCVKEFRSAVNNAKGYVYELPGGSSFKEEDARVGAQHELAEELGLDITDPQRLVKVSTRQMVATLSAYECHLFKLELNSEEFERLSQSATQNETHGVAEDSERTYVQVIPLNEIWDTPFDNSTLGQIFEALQSK